MPQFRLVLVLCSFHFLIFLASFSNFLEIFPFDFWFYFDSFVFQSWLRPNQPLRSFVFEFRVLRFRVLCFVSNSGREVSFNIFSFRVRVRSWGFRSPPSDDAFLAFLIVSSLCSQAMIKNLAKFELCKFTYSLRSRLCFEWIVIKRGDNEITTSNDYID